MANRGRPRQDIIKDSMVSVRMTTNERCALAHLAKKLGMNNTDVIKKGLKMVEHLANNDVDI